MMSDPETVQRRRAENWYQTQRFLDGSQKKEDDINQRLKEARLTRETMLGGRRMFGGFDAQNIFNEGIRHSTNNAMNKTGFLGNFTRLGAMINPRETFSKVGLFGMQLGHTGVAAGAVAAAGFGTALVGATTAIKKFSEVALSSYGELSKLKTSLGVVYGSEARADTVFDAIADYAVKSPFGVSQLTEMATLLKQSGIYESDLLDTLQTIGDLAGGNEEKYRRIANNYAQVLAIGKATTKDMREFANAGVPIFEATSDYLGISRKDLVKKFPYLLCSLKKRLFF
jgi:tape measure domain-containing protein